MGFCWWKRLSRGVLSCIHCVDFVPDSLCRFSCCVDFHVVGFLLMEFCPVRFWLMGFCWWKMLPCGILSRIRCVDVHEELSSSTEQHVRLLGLVASR